MTPAAAITRLLERHDLSGEEMGAVMRQIMGGEWTPAQIAGVLVALRAKGESVDEIAAAARVMRELSTRVPVSGTDRLVDTCGTGGDARHSFNVSTTAALVAAAAGARVAKHGGRSVSSSCGSADVLEALGVNVNLTPEQVARSVQEVGVGFMFAPNHHSAMKHAAPVRRELGVRTLFNVLGPLTNPAGAPNQVLGVFDAALVPVLARVLQALGSRHVMVVHGAGGLDEISLAGPSQVAELRDGSIREYQLSPGGLGLAPATVESIRVAGRDEARDLLLQVLANQAGPARDIVVANAGAALYVAGVASDLAGGLAAAAAVLADGRARRTLDRLVEFSRACAA